MFMNLQKENRHKKASNYQAKAYSYVKQCQKSEKKNKIHQLRQLYMGETLPSKLNLQKFTGIIQQNNNNYSLVLTLFDLTEDPLWRNKIGHICSLIKKLHNVCVTTYGSYLMELAKIPNYHNKLINIFYLNNPQIQSHFKLLITIYLSYNSKFAILNQEEISLGLIDSCRYQKQNYSLYLWMICQIKTCFKTIIKIIKIGEDCIHSNYQNKIQIMLPTITILSNYFYYEQSMPILQQLMDSVSFQRILMFSINQIQNYELKRQVILLCNNILARSGSLALKLLSSEPLITMVTCFQCEEQEILNQLLRERRQELNKF